MKKFDELTYDQIQILKHINIEIEQNESFYKDLLKFLRSYNQNLYITTFLERTPMNEYSNIHINGDEWSGNKDEPNYHLYRDFVKLHNIFSNVMGNNLHKDLFLAKIHTFIPIKNFEEYLQAVRILIFHSQEIDVDSKNYLNLIKKDIDFKECVLFYSNTYISPRYRQSWFIAQQSTNVTQLDSLTISERNPEQYVFTTLEELDEVLSHESNKGLYLKQ